jgi:hypothetical protein
LQRTFETYKPEENERDTPSKKARRLNSAYRRRQNAKKRHQNAKKKRNTDITFNLTMIQQMIYELCKKGDDYSCAC